MRVLLVSDDQRLREQFLRVTGDAGYVASATANSHAALRALAAAPHDLAVVDLSIPANDGQDLLERIRRRWSWVQLVLIYGVMDDDAVKHGIRYQAAETLARPCSQREVAAALARACRRRAAEPAVQAMRPRTSAFACATATPGDPARLLEEVEREHILAAVARTGGNRETAATELGISVRKLYYRLQQYAREGFRVAKVPRLALRHRA